MRVLWVCNIMLPRVAEHFHKESSSREGWLTGLSEQVLTRPEGKDITLGICFPTLDEDLLEVGNAEITLDAGRKLFAYPIKEDVHKAEIYDSKLEEKFDEIIQDFKPDLVHCFGTEFPHTLAVTKAFQTPKRTLIGIQGLCSVIAKEYPADIPPKVWRRRTFRDVVKKDDLIKQRDKFIQRGRYEREAIHNAGHIAGRTVWDQCYAQEWNPNAKYHLLNETLRSTFYDGEWNFESCQKGAIFLSQGDYPLKGLHYVLQAMPDILEKNPEAQLYVAGNSIVKGAMQGGTEGFFENLKLESYGKYIKTLLKHYRLQDRVHFVGPKTAEEMKELYLKVNVYICASALENSPNSLGEAMLLGVPCVSSKVGGVPSLFKDRVDGLLYEKNDIKALAGCVNLMLEGGDLVEKMRKSARAHAMDTHNPECNFMQLLDVYKEILWT